MKRRIPGTFKNILAIFLGSLFFLFLLFLLSVYTGWWGPVPGKRELAEKKLDLATVIEDHRGETIGKLYVQDRHPVAFDSLPPHLLQALIATEDARFYEHNGTDTRSLFRVFFKTIVMGDASSGGGSTLTQQLAKNLYGRKKNGKLALIAHKLRESIIASRLESIYTKDELLEKYLNTVPFSDNTYGIESASRRFFSKSASELTLPEAATLIGSLKATHTYNPRLFPERSHTRRNVVLHQMLKYGNLEEDAYRELVKTPTVLDLSSRRTSHGHALYFKEQIKHQLEEWAAAYFGKTGETVDLYSDGLTVRTTLDLEMQITAEEAVKKHLSTLQKDFEKSYGTRPPWHEESTLARTVIQNSLPYKKFAERGIPHRAIMDSLKVPSDKLVFTWDGPQRQRMSTVDSLLHHLKLLNVGWVSLHPSSGAVRTWIGGIGYDFIQYDHVAQSKRQVGSVFKPIVYATALEQGVPACRYYDLRKVAYENLDGWTPDNASDGDDGNYMNYSMEYALSRSVNTVAVKVMEDAGVDHVIETAKKMQIHSQLPAVPSLALGTAELSVMEVARAYTSFLNEGAPQEPYLIEEITDREGNVLYRHEQGDTHAPAVSAATAATILEMLRSVVREGTGKRLSDRYGITADIAGKTGTTQNNKDGWFVGLTPEVVSVSWVGLDDQRLGFRSTRTGQGANSALPLFALWWKQLENNPDYKNLTASRFPDPLPEILEELNCEPQKRDGFFKRLFKNPNKTRKKVFKGISGREN